MPARSHPGSARSLFAVLAALSLSSPPLAARAQVQPGLDRIPKQVMDALMTRFPGARIDKWTEEKEDGAVVYDFEFRVGGRKLEADFRADGSIHNWEEAVAARDLPAAVTRAVARRYPKATLREIMRITAVKNGKEALEGYEIVLRTAGEKDVEITLAPDGRILEEAPAKPS